MIRKLILCTAAALGLGAGAGLAQDHAAHPHVNDFSFSFEGPFGSFDQSQLQRGLQVYTEVCAACHGLKFVAFRNLHDVGGPALSEEQMRAYAAQFEFEDPATGETRPGTPPDHFPPSGLENAPDLSLMAKARAGFHGPAGLGINQILRGMGGPEYIASFVTGFTGEEREEAGVVLYENTAKGAFVAMNPVLSDDLVTYEDGTQATEEQMAQDVAAFLMWTAEPKMMARKQAGLTAVLFLVVLTVLLYFTNKKIWSTQKGAKKKHA
ncbi:cytochrome c1 [Amaricoccus sp.]|uniref:cytochrome c1 n=1 Tax=Amaricoccus sp. TaxID=1872485 RepID=UPI001B4C763C|nr:cytochrome c1 [Amaricoccus sp.]MBP7003088.1 cytochrome c1 [Amaricoccus sp.]